MLNVNQPKILPSKPLSPETDPLQHITPTQDTQESQQISNANQTQETTQAGSLHTGDQDKTQSVESHEAPANTMFFEKEKTDASNENAPAEALTLQNWDDDESIYADPAVAKLLEFVQDLEDKNFDAMMDMMQQSLDRAREMMEQAQERWVNVELPKKQAMESSLQEMDVAQSALNQISMDNTASQQQSMNIESAIGKIQAQIQNSPGLTEDNDARLINLLNAMKQVIQNVPNT